MSEETTKTVDRRKSIDPTEFAILWTQAVREGKTLEEITAMLAEKYPASNLDPKSDKSLEYVSQKSVHIRKALGNDKDGNPHLPRLKNKKRKGVDLNAFLAAVSEADDSDEDDSDGE